MAVSLWPLADVLQLGGDKISDPSLTVQEAKAIIAHALQLKRKADWEWAPQNHARSECLLQSPAIIL